MLSNERHFSDGCSYLLFIFNALKESLKVIKVAFYFDIFNPLAQTF